MNLRLFQNALSDLQFRPPGNRPCLDVLRSMAILLVLCAHTGASYSPSIQKLPFVFYGWSGVDLFFVLSGFLIGGQLWKELAKSGSINIGRFVLRRGFRIWPYYFFMLGVAGLWTLIKSKSLSGIWVDLFCISNYFPGLSKISGGWSLSTEEQFYILVPLLLYLGSRILSHRKLLLLPMAWLLALPLIRWVTVRQASPTAIERLTYFPFHTHSDGLAIGLIIAWITTFRPNFMKRPAWVYASVWVGACAIAFLMRHWDQAVFRFSSLGLIFGSTTFFLLAVPLFPRLINWHGGYIMSRLSYGMYLNHFYVLEILTPLQRAFGHEKAGFILGFAVCVSLSMMLAFLTFALIELPFLSWRDQWLKHPTPDRPAVPAVSLAVERTVVPDSTPV